ncbi:hypothetical protein LIER_31776 [Lithospermum erythrorhizon]|uniref:Uncharacterized protein n=1 Tax=Lithospermum erythrorhizon TaxID=34254 RepID=A0AAV3RRZ3_LITER
MPYFSQNGCKEELANREPLSDTKIRGIPKQGIAEGHFPTFDKPRIFGRNSLNPWPLWARNIMCELPWISDIAPPIHAESEASLLSFPRLYYVIRICLTLKDRISSNPATTTSYSASLLVASKLNRSAYSISIPLGPRISNPTPDPLLFLAPSTYTVHFGGGSRRLSSGPLIRCGSLVVHSTMQSARAWALILAYGS